MSVSLVEVAERTQRANEARSGAEYVEIATSSLAKLRDCLSRSIALANADVAKDGPMSPAGALVTASFTHIGMLDWALSWAGRKARAAPIETYRKPSVEKTILLFWPSRGWMTGTYIEMMGEEPPGTPADGFKADGDGCIPIEQPTHWMPLPDGPASAQAPTGDAGEGQ